jgi:fructosamine-3-kinase
MVSRIIHLLELLGDRSEIRKTRSVSGGSINRSFHVRTEERTYFIKLNHGVNDDFFRKEAEGLRLIHGTGAIRVPEVYGVFSFPEDGSAALVMEWVEGEKAAETDERLGRGLAKLHSSCGPAFGLEEDNYIGSLIQRNGWMEDWASFYRDRRIRVQVELGEERGTIHGIRLKKLEKLMEHLDEWIGGDVKPSLLHGDLWGGNWIVGQGGEPVLIDPAVYYGHHEVDLAFTELFGGFSSVFYRAYHEVNPFPADYEDRKPLYQLYYLLVHLNLFGEGYGSAVDRVLERYVG